MIVADTNLIVYLVMPSPYTEAAERLLIRDPDWVVPFLWRSEFRNVLSLYLRKGLIRFDQALAIQAEMETLFQGKEYDVTSLDVLSLTHHSGCSAYDCEFVALAKALDIKLVTMDRKLGNLLPGYGNAFDRLLRVTLAVMALTNKSRQRPIRINVQKHQIQPPRHPNH